MFDEYLWPQLEKEIQTIQAKPAPVTPARTDNELLLELLDLVRGNERRGSSSDFRQVKTIRILERLYEEIFQEKVPSLQDMERARKDGEALKLTDHVEGSADCGSGGTGLIENRRYTVYLPVTEAESSALPSPQPKSDPCAPGDVSI